MYRSMLMLALSTMLAAQQEPAAGAQPGRTAPPPGHTGAGQPARAAQEGQIMAQFFQLRVGRIQQSLGLPDDRARALAERWGRWDRDFIDRGRQMLQVRGQFNQILMGSGSEEEKSAKVKPLLDQFLDLRQQQEDGKRRFEGDILKTLSPAQQARMILLVEDIQGKIRETLREARHAAGGGRF